MWRSSVGGGRAAEPERQIEYVLGRALVEGRGACRGAAPAAQGEVTRLSAVRSARGRAETALLEPLAPAGRSTALCLHRGGLQTGIAIRRWVCVMLRVDPPPAGAPAAATL